MLAWFKRVWGLVKLSQLVIGRNVISIPKIRKRNSGAERHFWLLKDEKVTSVLVGASKPSQLPGFFTMNN